MESIDTARYAQVLRRLHTLKFAGIILLAPNHQDHTYFFKHSECCFLFKSGVKGNIFMQIKEPSKIKFFSNHKSEIDLK
jgi:hypothetical protein